MSVAIKTLRGLNRINFLNRKEDSFWNDLDEKEAKMHKIHIYPAKFPSLIAQKAFKYAKKNKLQLSRVADIFCGCGTVAVEAKRKGIDFWGCDINPVAVLISQAKCGNYDIEKVESLRDSVLASYRGNNFCPDYQSANERIKYWFYEAQYNDLAKLKNAIETETEDDDYRKLFLCLFSSILKGTSKWLTKSIKPQVDPEKHLTDKKKPADVLGLFNKQADLALKAIKEIAYPDDRRPEIRLLDVLKIEEYNIADMLVTSPPYVTSYEYADLHQLSALWLGYAEDYTELRQDSIGSSYGTEKVEYTLLPTAQKIVNYFQSGLSQSRAVARYYNDMHQFVGKSYNILRPGGVAVFVIGDTEYKTNRIENAKALCESMIEYGYTINVITKRKVQNKFLPSHRAESGKFSSNKQDRAIYSQEYIIIGRKGQ